MQKLFLTLSMALYICGNAVFGQAAYRAGNGVAVFDPENFDPAGTLSSIMFELALRNKGDAAVRQLTYRLETTGNLLSPAWSTAGLMELPPTDVGRGFETVTNLVMATNSMMFLRLRVETQ